MFVRLRLHSLFLLQCVLVGAVPQNRTIDDTFGDSVTGVSPVYTPQSAWDGPFCSPSRCTIFPSSALAFKNTYMAATYFPEKDPITAQFSFTGTDIYVFFILANTVPGATTETFCKFILDGQETDYHHAPSQSTAYDYNALVYSQHNLPNVNHTLLIAADGYNTQSFLNFDYAIYTVDDGTTHPITPGITVTVTSQGQASPTGDRTGVTSTHKSPTSAIVGGVVGGLLLLVLLFALLFLIRRRRRRLATGLSTSGSAILIPFTATNLTPRSSLDMRAVPHEPAPFLVPERKGQPPAHMRTASASTSLEALRTQRQAEISDHITGLTREMQGSLATRSTSGWEATEVSRVMEQNIAMKAQIQQLQAQLHSDWALGLSNVPPPGYSPGLRSSRH